MCNIWATYFQFSNYIKSGQAYEIDSSINYYFQEINVIKDSGSHTETWIFLGAYLNYMLIINVAHDYILIFSLT